MFGVLLNVLLHIPGDEKNQKWNHYWICSVEVFLQHLFRLQKISVVFKYILLITHPLIERFKDEFSAKNWTTTNPVKLAFSTSDTRNHTIAVHQDHPNLSQGYTSNPAAPCLHSPVLHKLLLFHSLQSFHCTSAAGAEGRCACVLKSQAPWNTAEPHTKHWAVSCSLGIKRLFTAAS